MIDSRWRYGSRMMLLTRSMSIGLEVLVTGSRRWPLPLPSSMTFSGSGNGWPAARGCVGVHSTNFSPISDCGRIVHSASERKSSKPARVIVRTTAAFWSSVTSSESILPTLTPAILTSSPGTSEKAFWKIARTL